MRSLVCAQQPSMKKGLNDNSADLNGFGGYYGKFFWLTTMAVKLMSCLQEYPQKLLLLYPPNRLKSAELVFRLL